MKKLILTAMITASTIMLYAQSSWELENETVNYNMMGTAQGTLTRTGANLNLISTTTDPAYLPCPTDGIVHVLTSSAYSGPGFNPPFPGNIFTLNQENGTLTFNATNSYTVSNRFSMYDLQNASPLTKLSFSLSFNENTSPNSIWQFVIGRKHADPDDGIFTKTAIVGNGALTDVFSGFRWVITNDNEGRKIQFQYRRKNSPTATGTNTDISSTLFEAGTTYDVQIICNNTNQPQQFMLAGNQTTINSMRTMVIVDNAIVAIANATDGASNNQVHSNIMPVNTTINSFAFSGNRPQTESTTDSEITLSNISWNYVKPSVLPVSFISFTGKSINEGIQLNWQTGSEEKNSRFEIYRSADGQAFSKIGSLSGNLNSNQINSYSFIDDSPFLGDNYYQLRQIDVDGKSSTYDKIIFIANGFGKEEFNAFVSQDKQVNIKVFLAKSERVLVRLTDITGRVIYQSGTTLRQNENHIQLPIIPLASGIYVVSMVNEDNKVRTAKIIL
ncbi:T9SS type A sorting domain-containing protein [Pseudopedobacter beijingensis]|uniref:T9SS type A sorting domain-containing protein n=1 Tax=Pseudopedobacter beijingensis TaxID=1207056 RepID=A0ABW4I6F8_9SPHI